MRDIWNIRDYARAAKHYEQKTIERLDYYANYTIWNTTRSVIYDARSVIYDVRYWKSYSEECWVSSIESLFSWLRREEPYEYKDKHKKDA